jgi:hypothetical protein
MKVGTFFIICVLLTLLCISCKERGENIFYSSAQDSIFLKNSKIPDFVKRSYFEKTYLWSKTLYDQITVEITMGKKEYYFYVKEIYENKLNRYLCKFDDHKLYFIPEYDSIEYDKNNIALSKFDKLSADYCNIPTLRRNTSTFNENFKKADDIKVLENLVNQMEIFKNYDIETVFLNNLLKELFILTQVQILNLSEKERDFYNLRRIFNNANAHEISSDKDLQDFQKKLKSQEGKIYGADDVIYYKCSKDIKKDLLNLIPKIRAELKNDNVVYFYTTMDYKLFRFEYNYINGKFKLKKEHLNKEYLWESPFYPFFFNN